MDISGGKELLSFRSSNYVEYDETDFSIDPKIDDTVLSICSRSDVTLEAKVEQCLAAIRQHHAGNLDIETNKLLSYKFSSGGVPRAEDPVIQMLVRRGAFSSLPLPKQFVLVANYGTDDDVALFLCHNPSGFILEENYISAYDLEDLFCNTSQLVRRAVIGELNRLSGDETQQENVKRFVVNSFWTSESIYKLIFSNAFSEIAFTEDMLASIFSYCYTFTVEELCELISKEPSANLKQFFDFIVLFYQYRPDRVLRLYLDNRPQFKGILPEVIEAPIRWDPKYFFPSCLESIQEMISLIPKSGVSNKFISETLRKIMKILSRNREALGQANWKEICTLIASEPVLSSLRNMEFFSDQAIRDMLEL
ncbi:MAG: hypothetical protein A3F09_02030 [Chlamydiae bacterium RIFCSPHIGHO2_12_FULL_49_11]|nr:MAG: hypothetical protein A3F09_02030 [Chlamydiae bacterium RIFCSPHIGHO2_12_FULL_49_11]